MSVRYIVPQHMINTAKEQRKRRDRRYGNLYLETSTDQRWTGDLGEGIFDYFLSAEKIPHEWQNELEAAGKPDFFVAGYRVGVKTVKRSGPILSGYTAQISTRHVEEPVDFFFFLSYEYPKKRMWLLGGCSKEFFLQHARSYKAGEQVHEFYTVRPGHAIHNIEIAQLTVPRLWIQQFRESGKIEMRIIPCAAPSKTRARLGSPVSSNPLKPSTPTTTTTLSRPSGRSAPAIAIGNRKKSLAKSSREC